MIGIKQFGMFYSVKNFFWPVETNYRTLRQATVAPINNRGTGREVKMEEEEVKCLTINWSV